MRIFTKNSILNKTITIISLVCFLFFTALPFLKDSARLEAAEFGMATDFLIQMGITYYDQGRFADAVHEFKKALMVDPNAFLAKEFLKQIEKKVLAKSSEEEVTKEQLSKKEALRNALDEIESKRELLRSLSLALGESLPLEKKGIAPEPLFKQALEPLPQIIEPQKTIILNEEIKKTQPNTLLEMDKESAILIKGDNIKRFLNTSIETLIIQRQDPDTLLVTAKEIGTGIFHLWDNSGRWSFNVKVGFTKFLKELKEAFEKKTYELKLSEPFKLTYSFDESTFHTGRRIDTTERKSLSVSQSVGLRGETPYGFYDSSASIARLNKENQISYLSMGLTDAHFLTLEHINLRAFDFSPGFQAFKFPSADLRGVRVDAPMFNNKLHYTTFWGGLPAGNYTQLQPGLGKTKEAFLEGVGINYKFSSNASYKFYYAHTYGSELNEPVLTDRAFGLGTFYKLGKLFFSSEVAYDDADHISYTTGANFKLSKTSLSLSFTEDDRDFVSPLGGQASGGSTSANFNISHSLNEDITLSGSFSGNRSRRFPNPDDPKRPIFALNTNMNWRIDSLTNLSLSYNRNDQKGSISPTLSQSKQLSLSRQIFFIKRINTYFDYINSVDKNFTGSSSNFDRNSLRGGFSFNLLKDVSFSLSKTINFIEDRVNQDHASPHVLDTALSYYTRFFNSPFYGNFRVSFRDEEESESSISFLSGEDRLEFQAGLDYRPHPNISGYLTLRAANIWAEKADSAKHFDAEIRYGLRLALDTGFRWNTKGNVRGFVFHDFDGDGVKDIDEQGIKNVVLNASIDKTAKTNEKGYYFIKNIVGKKANVSIDLKTIPRGYILTTPSLYEIDIKHGATKSLNFGVTTRSEIVGILFVDFNGNNKFDREDEPVTGVVMILDDKEKEATDQGGQYIFRKLAKGEHTLKIDLKTLPTKYIPRVPIEKKIILEEGQSYFYNIPLREAFQGE